MPNVCMPTHRGEPQQCDDQDSCCGHPAVSLQVIQVLPLSFFSRWLLGNNLEEDSARMGRSLEYKLCDLLRGHTKNQFLEVSLGAGGNEEMVSHSIKRLKNLITLTFSKLPLTRVPTSLFPMTCLSGPHFSSFYSPPFPSTS